MNKLTFTATVRKQGGIIETGRINSQQLAPLVGRKVKVTIEEVA